MRTIWSILLYKLKSPRIVTIIGGGGKTSLLYYLLRMMKEQGEEVLATTTTKLSSCEMSGHAFVEVESFEAACQAVNSMKRQELDITLISGKDQQIQGKVVGISPEWIDELGLLYPKTFFLVEADGSAGKSLKGHLPHEPVVPTQSSLVIVVIGIDSIGKKICPKHVHRPARICELIGVHPNSVVTTELVTELLFYPQGYLHSCSSQQLIVPFINKVESISQQEQAQKLGKQILARQHPQVCGVMIGSVMQGEGVWLQA